MAAGGGFAESGQVGMKWYERSGCDKGFRHCSAEMENKGSLLAFGTTTLHGMHPNAQNTRTEVAGITAVTKNTVETVLASVNLAFNVPPQISYVWGVAAENDVPAKLGR